MVQDWARRNRNDRAKVGAAASSSPAASVAPPDIGTGAAPTHRGLHPRLLELACQSLVLVRKRRDPVGEFAGPESLIRYVQLGR